APPLPQPIMPKVVLEPLALGSSNNNLNRFAVAGTGNASPGVMRDATVLTAVRTKYELLLPLMTERSRRQWAACEAQTLGRGGVTLVAQATGLSRTTISSGLCELRQRAQQPHQDLAPERIRAAGAGRPPCQQDDPSLLP